MQQSSVAGIAAVPTHRMDRETVIAWMREREWRVRFNASPIPRVWLLGDLILSPHLQDALFDPLIDGSTVSDFDYTMYMSARDHKAIARDGGSQVLFAAGYYSPDHAQALTELQSQTGRIRIWHRHRWMTLDVA